MTVTPKISKPRKIRFAAPFDLLIPASRPSKGVNPEVTAIWKYDYSHTINVNEESSYLEFAWECLRRNRYYMALIDNKRKSRPETEWGYQWHKNVARTHGLLELKPYTEGYNEGAPPRWIGLDSFAESLPTTAALETITVPITLKPGQVAIVFDLGGHFVDSPWNVQLFAAHEQLEKLAKKLYGVNGLSKKDKHKKVLVRRLAMFDEINSNRTIQQAEANILGDEAHSKLIQKRRVASPFPVEVIEKKASTRAYEDVQAAYDLIYRHGYIQLIGAEKHFKVDGNRFRVHTYDEIMNSV
jgi:hypothetical protein